MARVTQYSLLLSCCMILIQLQAMGQNTLNSVTLTGKVEAVVDTSSLFYSPPNKIKNDPYALPGATVVVMDLDSTIITGSVTDQKTATFKIEGLTPGNYLLRTSFITYETRYESLTIDSKDPQFVEIVLGNIYPPSDLPFNETHAINDLNQGVVQLKIWGQVIGGDGKHAFEDSERQEKFGYDIVHVYKKYADIYDQQWEKLRQATIRYNKVVDEYLSDEYGEKWDGLSRYW